MKNYSKFKINYFNENNLQNIFWLIYSDLLGVNNVLSNLLKFK